MAQIIRLNVENTRKQAQPVNISARWVILVLWAAFTATLPSFAQQPDAPATAKPDTAPQPNAANEADPPADEGVETMFPHFKDTRYWLSGQMNFIFQTHPTFPAAYSGQHSLGPNYEKATSREIGRAHV